MFFQAANFHSVISPFPPHRWALKNQFSSSKILKQLMRLIGLPSSPDKTVQLLPIDLYVKDFYSSFGKRMSKIHSWPICCDHLQSQMETKERRRKGLVTKLIFHCFKIFVKSAPEVITTEGFKVSTCLSVTRCVYSNERSLLSIYISYLTVWLSSNDFLWQFCLILRLLCPVLVKNPNRTSLPPRVNLSIWCNINESLCPNQQSESVWSWPPGSVN